MATISDKGAAAREFLAGLPEFSAGDRPVGALSDAYANRLAGAARRQLQAGIAPSRQAARGHVLTPEHPGGAAPKLPAELVTRIAEAREARAERTLLDEPSRPIIHRRQRMEGVIPYSDTGEIYTRNSEDGARAIVRYAADLGPTNGERLVMQVYDCSAGRWFPVFRNAGHGQGINAGALLEQLHAHGGSFERFLMDTVNDASYHDRWRVSHICQYEITILPRETAPVRQLREQVDQRQNP